MVLEAARTERHHRAASPILEVIRTGAGRGNIVCADLGSDATCQQAEGTQCYPNFAEAGRTAATCCISGAAEVGLI